MKIINGQTNAEPVTIGSVVFDMPAGSVWELGGPVVVRSTSYADGTNVDCVLLVGPGGVAIENPHSDFAYLDQGFTLGTILSGCVLTGLVIVKALRAGLHTGD